MNLYILKLDYDYIENNLDKIVAKVSVEKRELFLRNLDRKKGFSILFSNLLLKYCIKQELNLKEFNLEYNEYGKPYLKDKKDFFFNISHSKEYIILVSDNKDLGIDIEYIKNRNLDIMERIFTIEEQEYILMQEDKIKAFYEIWTLKESYIKALGLGLYKDLKSFSVTPLIKSLGEYNFKNFYIENYVISICSLDKINENIIEVNIEHL